MLQGDHSAYCWQLIYADTTNENTAWVIIDMSAAFDVLKSSMSNRSTYFCNGSVRLVWKGVHVLHRFSLPYISWRNGGVERMRKELLRLFRPIPSELRVPPKQWPNLLPRLQNILINTPSLQQAGAASVKAITEPDAISPITAYHGSSAWVQISVPELFGKHKHNFRLLCKLNADLRCFIYDSVCKCADGIAIKLAKAATQFSLKTILFLIPRDDVSAGEKLLLHWRWPRRALRLLNGYVYQVENKRNGALEDVDGTGLKYFSQPLAGHSCDHATRPSIEYGPEDQPLMRLFETAEGLNVQVRWHGLPTSEEIEEPLQTVYKNVPGLVQKRVFRKTTPVGIAAYEGIV